MKAIAYRVLVLVLAVNSATGVRADAVTEWNARASEIISASRQSGPTMYRTAALVQVAVFDAINAMAHDASVDAAVAAAARHVLVELVPELKSTIDAAYEATLRTLPDGIAKTNGITAGESAATALLASHAADDSAAPDSYRPYAAPGVYVPTTLPIGTSWSKRKPWLLVRSGQFRPGSPPSLNSNGWARDYNEIKRMGGRNSTQRTAEQTEIARFWSAVTPSLYFAIVRSAIDTAPRRHTVSENARLLAIIAMAMDDALIAVLDAKYTYSFWRPITAIRNADLDENPGTARDAGWSPLIETPLHPEYPCAHCILASTVGTVLEGKLGSASIVKLTSVSPTAPGVVRTWARVEDLVEEVATARIHSGVHYRNSTEVGVSMGKKIGELALQRY